MIDSVKDAYKIVELRTCVAKVLYVIHIYVGDWWVIGVVWWNMTMRCMVRQAATLIMCHLCEHRLWWIAGNSWRAWWNWAAKVSQTRPHRVRSQFTSISSPFTLSRHLHRGRPATWLLMITAPHTTTACKLIGHPDKPLNSYFLQCLVGVGWENMISPRIRCYLVDKRFLQKGNRKGISLKSSLWVLTCMVFTIFDLYISNSITTHKDISLTPSGCWHA